MAANGLKKFEILVFGPIGKQRNLTFFLTNRNLSVFVKKFERVWEPADATVIRWKLISQSGRENSVLYPDFLNNRSQN
jgi:hypothetical protein